MAACSEFKKKPASNKNEIFLEESADHCRNELANKLREGTKTKDLANLSDDEFLHLLIEATTFQKCDYAESILLKQLRKEVAETTKENELPGNKYSDASSHITSDSKRQQTKSQDDSKNALNSHKNVQQSLSLQDLRSTDSKSKEAATFILDSVNVTAKPIRKSNKPSNNSKGESTKSSLMKGGSKMSAYSGSASGHKRKFHTLIRNSSLPSPNEVGAPVNFPLQMVARLTDENGVTVWPQVYRQVSHFPSNMPVNSDSLSQVISGKQKAVVQTETEPLEEQGLNLDDHSSYLDFSFLPNGINESVLSDF